MLKHIETAMSFIRQRDPAAAEEVLLAHLSQQSADTETVEIITALRTNDGRWVEAERLLRERSDQYPESASLLRMLGDVLRARGMTENAEIAYLSALSAEPGHAEAALGLAGTRPHPNGAELLEQLIRGASNEQTPNTDRSNLYFAAGKIADDMGKFDAAFPYYHKANQLAGKDTSGTNPAALAERTRTFFSKAYLRSMKKGGHPARTPIFIVGMPRSGTTLLEQMLGRHTRVHAQGELEHLSLISNSIGRSYRSNLSYPDSMQLMPLADAARFGQMYLDKTRALFPSSSAKYSVDKMPLNFIHLGLLKVILPNARVIHIQRHPLDTCLSCFFQPFGLPGMDFTYSMDSLAKVYLEYRMLMQHWHKMFPKQVLDIDYEDLIQHPEQTLRRVMAYCKLDWDEKCLDPGYIEGPIRTASNWQARQPLYQSSRNRWQHYEPHIGPLMTTLADYLDR